MSGKLLVDGYSGTYGKEFTDFKPEAIHFKKHLFFEEFHPGSLDARTKVFMTLNISEDRVFCSIDMRHFFGSSTNGHICPIPEGEGNA